PIRGGGYRRLVDIIAKAHLEPGARARQRRLARLLFKSLRDGGILEVKPVPMARGQFVEVTAGLQKDFSLHQTLSLFLLDMLPLIDPELPTYALDVLTLVESVLEDPDAILFRQLDKLKKEKLIEL